jgi:hypothetical protein
VQNHPHGLAGCPHEQFGTRLSYPNGGLGALPKRNHIFLMGNPHEASLGKKLIGDVLCTGGVAG